MSESDGPVFPWQDINVLGMRVAATNIPELLTVCDDVIANGQSLSVAFTGVHGVMEAQDSTEVREVLSGVSVCVPDGMPLVVIGRSVHGVKSMDRCYGPDFMLAMMEHSLTRGYRHFFFGGTEGVADDLQRAMEARFPGLRVVGTHTPPFRPLTEAELDVLDDRLKALKPDCFWVGISTPKQERFMYENLQRLSVSTMFGVGAAFDFHTGRVKQAPRWMQRMCLEWLYRACSEPRRLMGRYLKNNPRFMWRYFLQLTKLRTYPLD